MVPSTGTTPAEAYTREPESPIQPSHPRSADPGPHHRERQEHIQPASPASALSQCWRCTGLALPPREVGASRKDASTRVLQLGPSLGGSGPSRQANNRRRQKMISLARVEAEWIHDQGRMWTGTSAQHPHAVKPQVSLVKVRDSWWDGRSADTLHPYTERREPVSVAVSVGTWSGIIHLHPPKSAAPP